MNKDSRRKILWKSRMVIAKCLSKITPDLTPEERGCAISNAIELILESIETGMRSRKPSQSFTRDTRLEFGRRCRAVLENNPIEKAAKLLMQMRIDVLYPGEFSHEDSTSTPEEKAV